MFSFCVPFLIFHCWQEHFFRKVQSSHCPVYNKWWPIDPDLSVLCSTKHILTIHIFSFYLHHTSIMFIMHMFKRPDFNCQSYNLYVDLIPYIYCQYININKFLLWGHLNAHNWRVKLYTFPQMKFKTSCFNEILIKRSGFIQYNSGKVKYLCYKFDLIKEFKWMYLTCRILLRFFLTMKRIKDKTIYSYYGCKLINHKCTKTTLKMFTDN